MDYILNKLEPKSVLHFFEELSSIPRGSYNEDKAVGYLVEFAKSRGLYVYCDTVNNVYIKKSASKGMEKSPAVLLQGHIDMVCEKNISTDHDFKKEGIKLVLDGDFLHADGTTLGADDGVSVAIMLALLDDDTLPHPPLECLMTVSEEVGLVGAGYIEEDKISARKMINIDTSTEGTVLVSCSGGRETIFEKDFDLINVTNPFIKISVGGLRGGHSGMNINEGRGNANKILGELLSRLSKEQNIYISEIFGGDKSNAIPRECSCVVAVLNKEKALEKIKSYEKEQKEKYKKSDEGIFITIDDGIENLVFDEKASKSIINMLVDTPNGVVTMSNDIENLVESSLNLGVVKINKGNVKITFSLRSSSEDRMNEMVEELNIIAKNNGAQVNHKGIYPGWEYEKESKLRDIFVDCYKQLTGRQMNINAVHCGLECGIIKKKIPSMDIVACGPNIFDCHTPGERLDIPSLERLWKLILKVLSNL